jgi:biopolymer transport protein ExbD
MKIPGLDKEETKLQMAPMIDMVFLLIIFFMTASHLSSSQSLRLDIPDAVKGVVPKERPDRWVVNIDRDGTIFSGNRAIGDIDELRVMVAERIRTQPDLKAYVRADKHTPYKQVRKVMNAMASAGIGDFIFGVYSRERKDAEVVP